ncbi:hypothetical protein C2G38_2035065 [Gigaspora rosea]|uniref:FAR1 domain-containing protein n=1 Tax=Gigaspora rosea TaxID=44941 RepID=A0A397VL94_9GLOM|nr:hypothetical protein C2G38_2035065 [Gigaspora rosea]
MELEVLDNQNIPKVLAAYDSTDDLSDIDIDNFNDVEEFSVSKTFEDWEQVADFMKKYASIKGHGIRIGDGGRVNTQTKETIKWTYLCRYTGKPAKSSEASCYVECPWKVNFWFKSEKNCIEVTTFNNQHAGHELNPLARHFDPTLRKLPTKIVEEIQFLTTIAKVNATMQYRIIREKYKIKIYRPDLYKPFKCFGVILNQMKMMQECC